MRRARAGWSRCRGSGWSAGSASRSSWAPPRAYTRRSAPLASRRPKPIERRDFNGGGDPVGMRPSYRWTPGIRFRWLLQYGGEPMTTALIVANQTLPSQALADAIAERIRSGVTAFYVVVPATPIHKGMTWDED